MTLVGKTLVQDNLLDVSGTIQFPQGITHKPDGKMFVVTKVGGSTDPQNRVLYAFAGSTPWDASSMSLVGQSSQLDKLPADASTGFTDLTSENGLDWYGVMDSNSIHHYRGTKPWDVTTIGTSIIATYSISGQTGNELGLYVTGKHLFYTNSAASPNGLLRCLNISGGLGSAYEVYSLNIAPTRAQACFVSPDGSTAYITDTVNRSLYQYDISTGFRTSPSASRVVTIDTTSYSPSIINPRGITADRFTGTRIAIADYGNSNIVVFKVT